MDIVPRLCYSGVSFSDRITKFIRSSLLMVLILSMMTSCQGNVFEPIPPDVVNKPSNNVISIAELQSRYAVGGVTILSDETIEGVAISSDQDGSFYKSLIIRDTTAAVELRFGIRDISTIIPCGAMVAMSIRGLTLGRNNNMFQLGVASDNPNYETDYITTLQLIDNYLIDVVASDNEPQPIVLKLSELNSSHVGQLVKIKGLDAWTYDAPTWAISADESYTGLPLSREIVARDVDYNQIIIFTSGYANFASEKVPSGRISVTGILSMTPSALFKIQMRSINDVSLD